MEEIHYDKLASVENDLVTLTLVRRDPSQTNSHKYAGALQLVDFQTGSLGIILKSPQGSHIFGLTEFTEKILNSNHYVDVGAEEVNSRCVFCGEMHATHIYLHLSNYEAMNPSCLASTQELFDTLTTDYSEYFVTGKI